ncbi:hypothetical protein [Paracoccus benzoatiresistens]|uniref:Uncharacterized protein n=1 Tax=Paracoccus benzoatiresistens TaxID=2997341 RepID=A0ABT4J0A5_9RHOB|nr:hypothetical protein [Paracoccus sp. EF6]MCZ0960324.1 hypothetical protein [Paracoccus sp. EF6]
MRIVILFLLVMVALALVRGPAFRRGLGRMLGLRLSDRPTRRRD